MSWTQRIRKHLTKFGLPQPPLHQLRRQEFEQDLEEEIQSHLQLETDQNTESGMTADEARDAARKKFGPIATSKENTRQVWGWATIDRLQQDLRFSARMLRKSPGFATVAILSLALGIGANTAIFSVVYGTLLDPLPYPDSGRLVFLNETFQRAGGQGTGSVSVPNLEDWRADNTVFEAIGGWWRSSFNLTGDGEPVVTSGIRIEPQVFEALQVQPLLGRYFTSSDSVEGSDRVVVLSHGLWERRFGSDSGILGETIGLNSQRFTVIGVMPPEFEFPPRSRSELWTPLIPPSEQLKMRGNHWMQVTARLKPGVTLEQAQANMDAIAQRLEQDYPGSQEGRGVLVQPVYDVTVGSRRDAVLTLWGAVGFVLLIACANVSNLLLARANARRREFSVRAALGASRPRLLRQLLTETTLVAVLGGTAGLMFSYWTVHYLAQMPGTTVPRGEDVGVNLWVLAFSMAVSLGAAILSGILPALRASKTNLHDGLKESAGRGQFHRRDRLRTVLVVAEVGLSLVVLTGAGLMFRSFQRLQQIDLGFRTENILSMKIPLAPEKYADRPADVIRFYDGILPRVQSLPGVESAGLINLLPLQDWGNNGNFHIRGKPAQSVAEQPFGEFRVVSPGYFSAMGIRLMSGRLFSDNDEPRQVVMINEAAAKAFWPGEDPIGKQLGWPEDYWFTVVGVVSTVRNVGPTRTPNPEIYWLHRVDLMVRPEMSLVVRTPLDPSSLAGAIQNEIWQVDPEQPVHLIRTMEQVAADAIARPRFQTLLFGVFAGLALVLALAGVYGVISYSVTQRTHEMGIRMALGARRRDVLRLVLGHGLALALIGTATGVAAALALTRYIESQLYNTEPTDPATFVAVVILLLATTLLACYIPARRAANVDPMHALRYE
jgi:putative ABC transport system permease protein